MRYPAIRDWPIKACAPCMSIMACTRMRIAGRSIAVTCARRSVFRWSSPAWKYNAMPVMAWVDFTWARNANPYGGAENGSGFTSTNSVGSNDWYYRTNVNIGYYF